MAAKLYIQLIDHMANTWKTGLDGYQVMQLNYTDSNEHTRIKRNFHLNINTNITIYINAYQKNKQTKHPQQSLAILLMVMKKMNSNSMGFCFAPPQLARPLHIRGTKGFPGHGWTASSGVRHGIPDESLGEIHFDPMKWTTNDPTSQSEGPKNWWFHSAWWVPWSRLLRGHPPSVWWLKHRKQAYVKCK